MRQLFFNLYFLYSCPAKYSGFMKKKILLTLAFIALSLFNLLAQEESFRITHGPYLQDMSENEVTIQ